MRTDINNDWFGGGADQGSVGVINHHSVLSTRSQVNDDVTGGVFLQSITKSVVRIQVRQERGRTLH